MNLKSYILILTSQIIAIGSYGGVNPGITVNPSSTIYIDLSGKSASGVIEDPTDPLLLFGIDFIITDEDVNTVVLTCSSDATSVVPNNSSGLIISGTGNTRNIKIKPAGIGYATITIRVKDNENKTASYTLEYASSAKASDPSETNFHTHRSSASTATAYDHEYMFVGDDEINEILLFHRNQSGAPLTRSEVSSFLNLPDPDAPEVDIEASCVSPFNGSRIYWMGSMSNSNSGDSKPNRDRLFATDISGTGSGASLSTIGYTTLRSTLITWGNEHGYDFSSSTASGKLPKEIDGFSLEGLEFAPDNTSLYLGFRTPFVPANTRTKALICPLLNFESWFNDGAPSGNPVIGEPIELDLGGRGIRSIGKNSSNQYLILAGAYDESSNFAIYQWTGKPEDTPVQLEVVLEDLSPEGIVEIPTSIVEGTTIEVVNDYGSKDWYADGEESKDLDALEFQKFSSVLLSLNGTITSLKDEKVNSDTIPLLIYPNPVYDMLHLAYFSETSESAVVQIYNYLGIALTSKIYRTQKGNNLLDIDCSLLPTGTYWIHVQGKRYRSKKFVKN